MLKKTYTAPALKTIALAAEGIICASETDIGFDKTPYPDEFDSGTHQWDSSNWSDADDED